MHNNIMVVGSRDRPPMLGTGRYAQWQSRFLRYIDTRPNGDALRKCILQGPYTPSTIIILVVPATDNTPAVPERITVETILNMSPENKAHYESEKEVIHWLLTRIGDEIYSTVDAYKTAHEMWIAIERLQQGESLNIQDVKTNLFWEFGKFTSHDGESMESYYSRFYKMMNGMIRNNLTVATMQSHKSYAPTSKASPPTRSHATTKHKGKETAKPITPPSKSASEEDNDPEQAQKDKEMQKNLALISKQFGNQRTVTVAGARETVGSQVVQQTGIRCFNFKEFGHFAKECRKAKRVKDSTYHKEKMLMCKQAEKGIPLQAEQSDGLADTDEEIDEQELEAHYSFMEKIQEVLTVDSGIDTEPLEHVQYDPEYNVFANDRQHPEQPESISNTCVVEKVDSNVILDSPDMCDNDIQTDQNAEDKRVALANLIANLKLDVDENKKIQKQLKKANTSLAHELKECKSILAETSRTLKESNRILAQKEVDIKDGLKLKAYEISVFKEKHDELVKQSLLTKSHYEGLVKEKTKIPYDKSDPSNRLTPDRQETLTLEKESRSKLNKDKVRPYDYTKLNSLYEIFKHGTLKYHEQLAYANEVRKKMWRKSFVKSKPKIFKNIGFLPFSKSISKSRQAYNVMTNNINHFREFVDQAWEKHSHDHFRAPNAHDMEILIKTCLMPLAIKTQNDSFTFVHELKQEMHDDLKYVESLKKEIDELESDKAEFSNMYDILLQECMSNDVMCSYFHLLSDLDAHTELQCLYLHKVKECECLAQKLSKQTETVSKEVILSFYEVLIN
ncbi:retrovirus-related pol polyprotein from transposon TNT 1-94 [Tanacetum coccineum]